jgi:hypothetical protein
MAAAPAAASLARDASCSALGSTTPATPGLAHNARSSSNHSLSAPLIRTSTGCRGESQAASASRAAALPAAGTASSRSTMTASAPAPQALSKRSGRLPGTNR